MKNIDIITFGNLDGKTGVNKVIENLNYGQDIFFKNNLNIKNIVGMNGGSKNKTSSKLNLKNIIKDFLEKLSKYSSIITFLLIYLRHIYRAKKVIKKYEALHSTSEILIFHDIFSAYIFIKKNKFINKKIMVVLHTNGDTFSQIDIYYQNQNIYTKKYLKRLEKFTLDRADKIIFVSQNSLDNFNKNNPLYLDKTICIYNGLIDDEFIRNKEFNLPIKFICVGTLNGRKGQELILETVSQLKDQINKKIIFYIIGGGPKYEDFYNNVIKLKLEDIIKVLGARSDISSLLSKSDIFILPSFDEGLPMAIIEAMRAGLPIISTNVGGIPEMITNDKEGFLINPSVEDIKKIILKIINNEIDLKKLSSNSRKTYEEKFSLESMIKKYIEVINEK